MVEGNVLCMCVFLTMKRTERTTLSTKSHPKGIHYVPPHVLSMNTTCCWSTARKIRLSKSLVASLQCTSLAACLSCSLCVCSCTNTHINTHIKPHTCSGQYGTPIIPAFKHIDRPTVLTATFFCLFFFFFSVKLELQKQFLHAN